MDILLKIIGFLHTLYAVLFWNREPRFEANLPDEPLILGHFPRFRSIESEKNLIAQGGAAEVYSFKQGDERLVVKLPRSYNLGLYVSHEFDLLESISHPNCSTLRGFYLHEGWNCPVMDYISNEDLNAYTQKQLKSFKGTAAFYEMFVQLSLALKYLHDNRILHRDLKPSNVMVNSTGKPIIIDFESADLMRTNQDEIMNEGIGTLGYLAPECFDHKPWLIGSVVKGRHYPASDVYALAVTFVIVYLSDPRYFADSIDPRVYQYHAAPSLPESTKASTRQLLTHALNKNHHKRLTGLALAEGFRKIKESLESRNEPIGKPGSVVDSHSSRL